MNEEKLMTLLGKIVGDLGAAYSVPLVRLGEQLGLCAALRDHGPPGEAKLREVIQAGGLTRIRRAAETPFNMVLEARA